MELHALFKSQPEDFQCLAQLLSPLGNVDRERKESYFIFPQQTARSSYLYSLMRHMVQ